MHSARRVIDAKPLPVSQNNVSSSRRGEGRRNGGDAVLISVFFARHRKGKPTFFHGCLSG